MPSVPKSRPFLTLHTTCLFIVVTAAREGQSEVTIFGSYLIYLYTKERVA